MLSSHFAKHYHKFYLEWLTGRRMNLHAPSFLRRAEKDSIRMIDHKNCCAVIEAPYWEYLNISL